MYKLSNALGSYGICQKMISANLAHYIRLCLGNPDDNGNLSDTKRAADFMKNVWYLKKLVGKKATVGNGILEKKFSWEEIILSRYSDILAKLEDTKHEFVFDEFGEGLIFALVIIRTSGTLDYLSKYGVYPYEPEQLMLVQFMEDGEELYNTLREKIAEQAPDYLDEVLGPELEEIEERFKNNGLDSSEIYDICAEMYARCILNISCYLDEQMDDEEMNIALYSKDLSDEDKQLLKDDFCDLFVSPICWDYDYEIVMSSLGESDSLDVNLKTKLVDLAGFNLNNYNDIFSGKDTADYFVPRAPVLSFAQHHCFLIANH